jgi:NitT/TauT family transport system substrate-binding protein
MKFFFNSRSAAALALIAVTVFVLAGCQKKNTAGAGGAAMRQLVIPLTVEGTGVPLAVIAYDLKYFEDEGLDVKLQPLNTGANVDQLMAVSTGKLDLSNSGGTTAPLLFIEQGNDLVIIGGTMGEGASLVARPDNVAQFANFTPQSLYGKKIGVRRANTGDVALRGWLARQGADLSKITFVELDGAATIIEALRKGELDVGNIFTFWRSVAEKQGLPVFLHIDDLTSDFPCCRITTSAKNIKQKRDDYVAFLKALIRAYKVFTLEHEKTLDITSKYFDADRELLETVYYTYGHYLFNPDPDRERVLEFYRSMVAIGYAKGEGDIPSHVDSSLYRDALNQILAEYPDDSFFREVKKHFDANN